MTDEYALRKIIALEPRWFLDNDNGYFIANMNSTKLILRGSSESRIFLTFTSNRPGEGHKRYTIYEPGCPIWTKEEDIPIEKKLLNTLLDVARKQFRGSQSLETQYKQTRDELLREATGWNEF
jgi:hypothetical protein